MQELEIIILKKKLLRRLLLDDFVGVSRFWKGQSPFVVTLKR